MKHKFQFFISGLLTVTLFCLTSTIVSAQENNTKLLQTFIGLTQKPSAERNKLFSDLPTLEQTQLLRLNIALSLMNRNDYSREQSESLIGEISKLSPNRPARFTERSLEKIGDDSKYQGLEIFENIDKNNPVPLLDLRNFININTSKLASEIREVLNAESPEFRKSYWKTKLALHLATETYSPAQYEIFLEVRTILHSEFIFRSSENKDFQAILGNLAEKSMFVFVSEDAFRIFMSPGGELTCGSSSSETTNLSGYLATVFGE